MDKATAHQEKMQDEFWEDHPGQDLPKGKFWNESQRAVEEEYASYGLGWLDLYPTGWDEHHIQEVNWGGAPRDNENLIYLRNAEHKPFSAFWKFHQAAINESLKDVDAD
jgi:hypothetical protein